MNGLQAVRNLIAGVDAMGANYTYSQLLDYMTERGNNLADVAIGRMMEMVADEMGEFPEWDDIAPTWVVRNCMGGR